MESARSVVVGAVSLVALAACCNVPPEGQQQAAIAAADEADVFSVADGVDCPEMGPGGYVFWMEPRAVQPGDTVDLVPYFTEMPGAFERLPGACVSVEETIGGEYLTLSRREDGTLRAVVSEDVEPGVNMRIDTLYAGEHPIAARLETYTPAANPLVGRWKQDGSDCPAESAVRELIFSAGGDISVTWTPFESYKDYWGDYTYDVATGAFSFTPKSGNQIPEDMVQSGTATVDGDRLVLETAFLGTPSQASGPCLGDFTR
ncbi:hypothetical protein [Henriciella litoralis]|uniref:hypothetical protein n=1 Tax=Henriciella litoralis TaxID=568102 RepID=UPI00111BF988|nr:hypothetical protein [Henriciella litoralis]